LLSFRAILPWTWFQKKIQRRKRLKLKVPAPGSVHPRDVGAARAEAAVAGADGRHSRSRHRGLRMNRPNAGQAKATMNWINVTTSQKRRENRGRTKQRTKVWTPRKKANESANEHAKGTGNGKTICHPRPRNPGGLRPRKQSNRPSMR